MDYQALNSLLPPVSKAHSIAKVVLTLEPLPKFDKMCVKLAGSNIYSTLDLRSGYYNIDLSVESQKKSALATPMGKFEVWKVPIGLA